jgi:hypothetical protein
VDSITYVTDRPAMARAMPLMQRASIANFENLLSP